MMKRRDFVLRSVVGSGVLLSPLVRAQIRPCPLPSLGVDGGTTTTTSCSTSDSALATAVRAMPARSWARMSPAPASLGSVLGVGEHNGDMLAYMNQGAWNPIAKAIEIIGQDHGWGNMRHVRYDEATNSFVFVGNIGTPEGHGYDHTEVNPFNGDIYYKAYTYGTGGKLWRKPFGGGWDSQFQTVPIHQQVGIGCCWWKGPMSPKIGAQGAFMLADGDFGAIAGYDPVANSWFTITSVPPVSAGYHGVMAYSAVHNCAVWGGGNAQPRRVFRVNANRTVSELASAPGNCELGIYAGGLCCDPTSGNFLVLSGGNLFELNPTGGGTWTQLSGSSVPPSEVNDPASTEDMIMCELPDHGVIAVISMSGSAGNMYLYRHA